MSDESDIGETWDSYVEKHKRETATIGRVAAMLKVLTDAWTAMNAKNITRNARLDALEARLAALEARPSVQDKGVWQCGQVYDPGDIVSRGGSAWICNSSHLSVGNDLSHDHFRLLAKRGRDARDTRS